jgi:HlyD family secretion protein
MRKLKVLLLPLVIILIVYGAFRYFTANDTETARLALGTLERDRITLAATAAELIVSQPVAEGSHVEAGTLLVQLDPTLQQTVVNKVHADIAQIDALLLKLRNGVRPQEIRAAAARVDSARTALDNSERDLIRISALVLQKLAPTAQLDTATALRDSNAARLRDAQAQLDLLQAGSRGEDVAQAEAQLAAVQAQLTAEEQRLSNLAITATVSGTLDSLPWNTGERVGMGSQVAVLLAEGAPYARVYIPETSRVAVTTGASLVVHVDGVAEPLTGRVRWISQDPAFTPYYALNSAERSRLVYMAEVQLPDSASTLPAGLPAQVELP